ncbi:sulfatase [Niabella yanshanensis]|uniref:Sulfatase n=1 Tax=Niabella yanshanensis TaxID=577386 RepID=A0ABZ0WDK6_9BACT|nr:sulfatase [Niabella yanshanensis]WQD40797.1 sulfatase [Niabella yanshanensis]
MQVSSQTAHTKVKPNILFAISDDQSYYHTSINGCTFVKTPAFDQIARRGVFFTNCIAGSPGCAPSRSAIVTGRYPWQNEQAGQHASSWMKKYISFIDLLASNGYHTGYTGKGVDPFQYARNENDSLWRKGNAAGKAYNSIRYQKGDGTDPRPASGISDINYYENFKNFYNAKGASEPFFFWYGAAEPHRGLERGSWKRSGKTLKEVQVPPFLPDNDTIRGDLLDYAIEIEWFDCHLQKMLDFLKEKGALENTIVIVTSDNGMAFPRAKANCYEYGIHVPFAFSYPDGIQAGKIVEAPVSFTDIAPTLLELTKTTTKGMMPISGKSFLSLIDNSADSSDHFALSGRERHSYSRYNNWGYPQRALRNKEFLFIWNIKPKRWPAGDPQRLQSLDGKDLFPKFGIDTRGIHHPEWAFTDIDASPSKSFIIEHYKDKAIRPYFDWSTALRPEYELYRVSTDPGCLHNLSGLDDYQSIENKMKDLLVTELQRSGDPRITAPLPEIFDSYERYSGPVRAFPEP